MPDDGRLHLGLDFEGAESDWVSRDVDDGVVLRTVPFLLFKTGVHGGSVVRGDVLVKSELLDSGLLSGISGSAFLRGDLPPACSISFTADATGGYPGGVAMRTDLRCTYGVVAARRRAMHKTFQPRTYRKFCCMVYARYVPAWHFTDCVLLTEQARGGVRQV